MNKFLMNSREDASTSSRLEQQRKILAGLSAAFILANGEVGVNSQRRESLAKVYRILIAAGEGET